MLLAACALTPLSWAQEDNTPAPEQPAPVQEEPPLPPPSPSARDLFERSKDAIVQVRLLLKSANEQSSIGSGFVVRTESDGSAWVVTNYHVVSELALQPHAYQIELRGTDQTRAPATLVAIDVIHDLAVLRTSSSTPQRKWPTLEIRSTPIAQGTSVYSLGNPLELGFLISDGIYNGAVENRLYEQMLFSGALNPGMSGGPALDSTGEVVGVNVATRRDGDLLSFLVPVRYLRPLLERAWTSTKPSDWQKEIGQQLVAHQGFLTQALLGPDASAAAQAAKLPGFSTQRIEGREVMTLDSAITRCWANGDNEPGSRYLEDRIQCALNDEVYVSRRMYTGSLNISHVLIRNQTLATPQFLEVSGYNSSRNTYVAQDELTPDRCHSDYLQGKSRVYRVSSCLQTYREFPGIFNFSIRATQVDSTSERLYSQMTMSGFSFDNARRLGDQFLRRLP
ncbi:hypothetical protein NBRC116584_09020 [Hydrogenophaga sp. 5NK40-0174]